MKKDKCIGCYNNIYNNGAGGAKECWSFKTAKVVWRKMVHADQIPPYTQKAIRVPDCYHKPRYFYIDAKRQN